MGKSKWGQSSEFFSTDIIDDDGPEAIPVITEEEIPLTAKDLPTVLPILPLRNTVLFPGVVLPITVGRKKSLELIREIYHKDRILGAISQIDGEVEDPGAFDLFQTGTIARILKILEMPDGSTSVIIQGQKRFHLDNIVDDLPYLTGEYSVLEDTGDITTDEFHAILESLKDLSIRIIKISENMPQEAAFAIKNIESPSSLINFVSSNTDIKVEEKQKLLETDDLKERGLQTIAYLVQEAQMLDLKKDIQSKVKTDLDQQQREYLLQQQMKTIQDELGGNPIEQEVEELRKKGSEKKWSEETATYFEKEVDKMLRLNPATGEYSVQLGYVQTLLDLPWNEYTTDNFDLHHAQKVLDEDHFGLENVKERILEHLAVLKLKQDLKSPIICLYGPPGVGKTSLGKSIAKAIGRNYVRVSLGGLHDEAEIRGHRKTYIGAMPGRIIQNIKKAKSSNPLFVLDEIDKVSKDFNGDPASAMLEVLDPEQNFEFHDNYLEVDYDLSKVMFIATANNLSTISPALRDRMELIEVSGYLLEEKAEIALRHLLPKQLKNHGLKDGDLIIPRNCIERIIERYTRESGVRELDQKLAKIIRKIAKKVAFDEPYDKKLTLEGVRELLGVEEYTPDKYQGNEFAGVVTGLAWTSCGGEILFVESSISKGKGRLTLTGNLGDVMKESAIIALEYLKAHSEILGLRPEVFDNWNVHIHVPEGAIPKDGPSAGVTMATSLASAFTQRKIKKNLAMTGEITLRGKVLPVGGIKEKILAAKRAGIREIIISEENRRDIEEIKEIYIRGLTFHYVNTISEVLNLALLKQKVEHPVHVGFHLKKAEPEAVK